MSVASSSYFERILDASSPFFQKGFHEWLDKKLNAYDKNSAPNSDEIQDTLLRVQPLVNLLSRDENLRSFLKFIPNEMRTPLAWYFNAKNFSLETLKSVLEALRNRPEPMKMIGQEPQIIAPLEIPYQPLDELPDTDLIYPSQFHEVTPSQISGLLHYLFTHSAEGSWLDIGFGDGQTTNSLARRHPQKNFIGFDVLDDESVSTDELANHFPHLREGPNNVSYHLATPSHVKEMIQDIPESVTLNLMHKLYTRLNFDPKWVGARQLRKIARRNKMDIASIFYPFTYYKEAKSKPHALSGPPMIMEVLDPIEIMITSALYALKATGTGVILTENPKAAARALGILEKSAKVESIFFSPLPLVGKQVQDLGVVPFHATGGIATLAHDGPAANVTFNWAYPIAFQKRPNCMQSRFGQARIPPIRLQHA